MAGKVQANDNSTSVPVSLYVIKKARKPSSIETDAVSDIKKWDGKLDGRFQQKKNSKVVEQSRDTLTQIACNSHCRTN